MGASWTLLLWMSWCLIILFCGGDGDVAVIIVSVTEGVMVVVMAMVVAIGVVNL